MNKRNNGIRFTIEIIVCLSVASVCLAAKDKGANATTQSHWTGFSHEQAEVLSGDLNDTDEDGVVNARDICQNSVVGAVVDQSGCEIELSRIDSYNLNIQFDTNQSRVAEAYMSAIANLADRFKQSKAKLLLIEGHTDNIGGQKYNLYKLIL